MDGDNSDVNNNKTDDNNDNPQYTRHQKDCLKDLILFGELVSELTSH